MSPTPKVEIYSDFRFVRKAGSLQASGAHFSCVCRELETGTGASEPSELLLQAGLEALHQFLQTEAPE